MRRLTTILPLLAAGLLGCGRPHDHAAHGGHGHSHVAPHGGTAVVLGNEAFHLEVLQEPEAGALNVWVLDAHMERFVRVAAPSLEMRVNRNGAAETLTLPAVANPATGETVGDTSQFQTKAEWLRTPAEFTALIPRLEIRGQTFTNVAFPFPKGNE